MLSLSPTVDVYEAAILLFFGGALAMAIYNLWDAWQNELAALDAGVPDVALLGLEDLLRGVVGLFLMAAPGVGIAVMLMQTSSPLQEPAPGSPELVTGITLRVGLIFIAFGLFSGTAFSAWLRHRMARRRDVLLATAGGGAVAMESSALHLEQAISENIGLTREAVQVAKEAGADSREAAAAANHVNLAIKRLGLGLKDLQEGQPVSEGGTGGAPAPAITVEEPTQVPSGGRR